MGRRGCFAPFRGAIRVPSDACPLVVPARKDVGSMAEDVRAYHVDRWPCASDEQVILWTPSSTTGR